MAERKKMFTRRASAVHREMLGKVLDYLEQHGDPGVAALSDFLSQEGPGFVPGQVLESRFRAIEERLEALEVARNE